MRNATSGYIKVAVIPKTIIYSRWAYKLDEFRGIFDWMDLK